MVATVIGIDYGRKRVGVAVGNTLTKSAEPLLIIERSDDAQVIAAVKKLINEWQPNTIALGIPRQPDDTPHAMTAACLAFAAQLREAFNVLVVEVDERYSSAVLCTNNQRRADGKIRAVPQDDKAAAVILQQYLDSV